MHYPLEPFRIKVTEPIWLISRVERKGRLKRLCPESRGHFHRSANRLRFQHFVPTYQGRAAENILSACLVRLDQ